MMTFINFKSRSKTKFCEKCKKISTKLNNRKAQMNYMEKNPRKKYNPPKANEVRGWCYFKKGHAISSFKRHCLKENWTSLCGHFAVPNEEKCFIYFIHKSEINRRKICQSCEIVKKRIDEQKELEDKYGK